MSDSRTLAKTRRSEREHEERVSYTLKEDLFQGEQGEQTKITSIGEVGEHICG